MLDNEGYLLNLKDWSREIAITLAKDNDIELTNEHWDIIRVVREFYDEFKMVPSMRPLVSYSSLKLGSRKGNSIYLNRLFGGSPVKIIAKLAGLPRPGTCF